MSALNFWITYKLIKTGLKLNYSFTCEPPAIKPGDMEVELDHFNSGNRFHSFLPFVLQIINYVWLHMFSKFIELFDTVFIVIRKKDRQLSFLHVYHHSSVLVYWWVYLKWVPSGSGKSDISKINIWKMLIVGFSCLKVSSLRLWTPVSTLSCTSTMRWLLPEGIWRIHSGGSGTSQFFKWFSLALEFFWHSTQFIVIAHFPCGWCVQIFCSCSPSFFSSTAFIVILIPNLNWKETK